MRSEQAAKNLICSLILQIATFISGIILPRFLLEAYGPTVNGMVTSITQFLTYLSLAEAGVGSASVVALYVPLAAKRDDEVNSVLSATRLFYYRSGSIFTALVVGLIIIYPYLISNQIASSTARLMIMILACSTLIDYLFLGKYKALLNAMQRGYVVATADMLGVIGNIVFSITLIKMNASILTLKAAVAMVYFFRFILVRNYVRRKLPNVNFKATPNFEALSQRGAALLHQIVGIIVNNTDVVIMTIMLGARSLIEVSVYGIYNMVVGALYMLLNAFANGMTAGFGEVISKKETNTLKTAYSTFEYFYFMIFTVVCACVGILLVPFVYIYTINIQGVNYNRLPVAILFIIIIFLQNLRLPGLTMICAAGHFKETRPQAVGEAVINLVISLLLVRKLGMVGVLFGTVCSHGFRSLETLVYNSKHIVIGSGRKTAGRVMRNFATVAILCLLGFKFIPKTVDSFVAWFILAIIVGTVCGIIVLVVNYIFEPDEFKNVIRRISGLLRR